MAFISRQATSTQDTFPNRPIRPLGQRVIFGALAYFVAPIDAIPDITPVVGFTDDLAAILGALAVVAAHITPEVKRQAADKLTEWFD